MSLSTHILSRVNLFTQAFMGTAQTHRLHFPDVAMNENILRDQGRILQQLHLFQADCVSIRFT